MADKDKAKDAGDGGAAEVAETKDAEEDAGARVGDEGFVDPTPNENYTVAGVTSGKPTPETDAKAAEKAKADKKGG